MAENNPRYWVVIPAAGVGRRMGLDTPKQYLPFNQHTMIEHIISLFTSQVFVEKVVVALHPDDELWSAVNLDDADKVITTMGGDSRAASVLNGLECLRSQAKEHDWVIVHDAVRPCLQPKILDRFIKTVGDHSVGGLLAMPIVDTVKQVDEHGSVEKTLLRDKLWVAQTPQMFRYGVLCNAMKRAIKSDADITDEASAVELIGERPVVVEGDRYNIKITRPQDLEFLKRLQPSDLRIGYGYDAHRFIEGDHVMMGGVNIPHDKGIKAHSDGDVLLHAIGDALLGAAALGDLGKYFPDTDPAYKNADSSSLLKRIFQNVQEKNYTISNVDATVILEKPTLAKHIDAMREHIANLLHVSIDHVNVKATTNEKMGWIGRKEGVAAQAVVLIKGLLK